MDNAFENAIKKTESNVARHMDPKKLVKLTKAAGRVIILMSLQAQVTTAMMTLMHSKNPKERKEAAEFIATFSRGIYLLKTPMEKVLSKRTVTILKKNGINSLIAADKLSTEELLAISGIGPKRAKEIAKVLQNKRGESH